jgi:AraC-like DNA-binding protein
MQRLSPPEFQPVVRIANRHPAAPVRRWGPRTIPDLQFILVLSGTFRYQDEHGATDVQPGEVLCIEPEIRHTLELVGRSGELSGMHLELLPGRRWAADEYRSAPLPPRLTRAADPAAVREAFIRAAACFADVGRYRQARLSAIAREALLLLAETWSAAPGSDGARRTAPLVAHIREHARRGVDRHELARLAGLTPEHINALFKRELGLTPRDVLNHERCRLAYQLIHDEGLSVAEAAEQAGYADPYYFSRVFRALYAVPPSRVR